MLSLLRDMFFIGIKKKKVLVVIGIFMTSTNVDNILLHFIIKTTIAQNRR